MGCYCRPKLLTATKSNEERFYRPSDKQIWKGQAKRAIRQNSNRKTRGQEWKLDWAERLNEPGYARRAGRSSSSRPELMSSARLVELGSLSSARLVGISSAHPADFRKLGSWASRTSFYRTSQASDLNIRNDPKQTCARLLFSLSFLFLFFLIYFSVNIFFLWILIWC